MLNLENNSISDRKTRQVFSSQAFTMEANGIDQLRQRLGHVQWNEALGTIAISHVKFVSNMTPDAVLEISQAQALVPPKSIASASTQNIRP